MKALCLLAACASGFTCNHQPAAWRVQSAQLTTNPKHMAVSSKSIIHYTEQLDSLKGIINSSGFRLKYCFERIVLSNGEPVRTITAAFPMVSFCDLPLTLAKEHIGSYGSYGIGLSKEWAKRNHLNPVLYLEYGSVISNYILNEGKRIVQIKRVDKEVFWQERDRFTEIVGFCKNHEGPLIRKGEMINPNYAFYNEREWRYLPDKDTLNEIPINLSPSDYENDRESWNKEISSIYLHFGYDDIRYIIVKSEEDITHVIKCLRDRYESEGISATKLNSLYTRILTVERIQNDF